MRFIKRPLLFALFVLSVSTAFAQMGQPQMPEPANPDDVTAEEVETFVAITNEVMEIRKESQQQALDLVKESDMTVPRFQEIMQASRNPQQAQQLNITPEEQETIKNLEPKLTTINQMAQNKFVQAIQNEGMEMNRFQSIARAAQADQEFARRIEDVRAEGMEGEAADN